MHLTNSLQIILEKLVNSSTNPIAFIDRSKIILLLLNNHSTYYIVNHLATSWKTVQKWRDRWDQFENELEKIKIDNLHNLKNLILEFLRDGKRSGKPSQYSPEQIVKIISLACTPPASHGIPLTHWNSKLLAAQAAKMGIVSKISPSKVSTILKQGDIKPHRIQYWLNSRTRNTDSDFNGRVSEICSIYQESIKLHEKGIHVISIDEKSGIQALERANPNLVVRRGSVEKIEHEYIRHGMQCLIANFEVGTGKIITPYVNEKREESDFLVNIQNLLSTDTGGEWIIILDQLNIHKSPSLVKWIANQIGIKEDLGVVRKKGILKSMVSRMKFLETKSHRIRFLFTPKRCS